jgi:hypothetical protein
MASRSHRGHKELTRVGSFAVAAVVIVMAAGVLRARLAGPEIRTVSVLKETPHPFRPTTALPAAQRSTASSMPRHPTTTTRVAPAVTVTLPDPTTLETTTTTRAQLAGTRRQALGACLALASGNHYEVIAANEVWFQQQLRFIAAHRRMPASPQFKELEIEEAQALLEIDAQYTIDKSNCYLK